MHASVRPGLRWMLLVTLAAGAAVWRTHAEAQAAATSRAAASDRILLDVGGRERQAIIVNPPPAEARRPAVIVLHGGMGSAEDMRARSGFDDVARANGFMVAYGQGTEFRDGARAWNTGSLLRRQVRDADDIAYLDALIDRLIADHGADPARIFMTGGSNGGMMTLTYAVKRAERLAAVAPVVASMFSFDTVPKVPLPILLVNGAKDNEVPLDGGMSGNPLVRGAQSAPFKPVREVVDFWVKANASEAVGKTTVSGTVTTTVHPARPNGAVTEFVLDSAGGHGWPGSRARRGENTPISAFRAADRVWAFFADKSRSPKASAAAPASGAKADVLDFPDLADAARSSAGATVQGNPRRVPIRIHVPAGAGPFPVIVVSHGAGGDRDTHFGQAQHLASHGYAVLCVEHVGSNRERLREGGLRMGKTLEAMTRDAVEVLARPKDVSFAIDQASRWNRDHERLRGRLDLERVGVMGHSFGAYTTMVACGMRPALDWLTPRVDPGTGLGPDLRDRRVRCGVALSPQGVGEPFFVEESFGSLRVPLLGITGSKDDQQGERPAAGRKDAFARWPAGDHRLVWIVNARHGDFTSASGASGRSLPSPTREDVQPVTQAVTLAFFDIHLRGDTDAANRLTADGLRPFLRGDIDGLEVLSK
ncbi:MAG: prolyl oligopeptidase family serine peptidase [Phycisphaerales bacterium]